MKRIANQLIINLTKNQPTDKLQGYTEISQDENGFNSLKPGSHIRYKFFSKIKSAGFLIMIKRSPLPDLKDLNLLVLKNDYGYFELPFYKYQYYQKTNNKSNKSIFQSKEQREQLLNKCRNNIINKTISSNNNKLIDDNLINKSNNDIININLKNYDSKIDDLEDRIKNILKDI